LRYGEPECGGIGLIVEPEAVIMGRSTAALWRERRAKPSLMMTAAMLGFNIHGEKGVFQASDE